MDRAQKIATINSVFGRVFNRRGKMIVEEAERAGIPITLACALVEQESGGRNIFGCDWGSRWIRTPPYCNVWVTEARVQKLLANIANGGGQNGVGLTQLTAVSFVKDAEAMGGAHKPRYQCRVGFDLLKNLTMNMGERRGIGAYNGGPGNPIMSYADSVLSKRDEWRRRFQS